MSLEKVFLGVIFGGLMDLVLSSSSWIEQRRLGSEPSKNLIFGGIVLRDDTELLIDSETTEFMKSSILDIIKEQVILFFYENYWI